MLENEIRPHPTVVSATTHKMEIVQGDIVVHKHTRRSSRRNPTTVILTVLGMLAAAVGIAAFAGAIALPEGKLTLVAQQPMDSGHYLVYPAPNGVRAAVPIAGMWIENNGTTCQNLGTDNSDVVLYLDAWKCILYGEAGFQKGGNYDVIIDPPTRIPAPKASSATTASTTSTTATKPEPDACEHAMKVNEVYLVHKGCSVKGDVQVASSATGPWTTLYDEDPSSGLVVTFAADTYVRTPWGANVTSRTLASIEEELKSVGCVSGCTTVVKKTWPEGTTTTTTGSTTTTAANGTTTTTTNGSSTSTTAARDCAVTTIASGQTKNVPSGSVLDGDVKVNGTALYDNDSATALRVVFNESASVSAEWGASYVKSGCETAAAANVTVKMWPSGSTATTTTSATHNMTNSTSATATTATSTSTTASSTVTADTCVAQIANGQTLRVKAGCHVQGDVQVDGVAKYDNAQETGLIVVLTKDADVKAPWGASVSSAAVEDIKASMMMVGCGLPAGCTSVNVVTV